MGTGVGPFADAYHGSGWAEFPLQIAFVRNDAHQDSLKPFTDFLDFEPRASRLRMGL